MPTAVKRLGVEAIIAVLRKAGGDPPTEVGREFGGAIKALNFTNEGPPLGQQVIGELLPAVQIVDVLGVTPPPDDGWHGLDKRVLLSRGREVEWSIATSSPVSECENR